MKKLVPDPPTSYRDPALKAANATLRVALARQPLDPALFQLTTQAKPVSPTRCSACAKASAPKRPWCMWRCCSNAPKRSAMKSPSRAAAWSAG